MTKENKHQSFMYSNVYLEHGPGLVKGFIGPIYDSYRTGRSVVKVRKRSDFYSLPEGDDGAFVSSGSQSLRSFL